jgi:hypothetical protein
MMMGASLAAKMLAMAHDRVLAELAIAFRAVTGFIRHGTDSLGNGCLGLEGQAVISSVGAAAGCDLFDFVCDWGVDLGSGLGAYPLLRVLPLAVSLLQRLTFPDAEK